MMWSPGLTLLTPRPDLLDDAGRLVAEDHGQRWRPVAVHDVPVAVADTSAHHLDARLTTFRSLLLDVDDLEPLVGLVQYRRFHGKVLRGAPIAGAAWR